MELAVVSFTPGGKEQAERIKELLVQSGEEHVWKVTHAHKPRPLQEWCRESFGKSDALLFIGAMGIAVRTIAPFLQDKTKDPAVLVMDERAEHVISVLSGHIGGANELACFLAERLGAEPVITTASDVNHKIAIDVFAKKNHLVISDMRRAKEAAAAIVEGRPVSFRCEGNIKGQIPQELSTDPKEAAFQIAVTPYTNLTGAVLQLIPKAFVLGIGCKKGKTMEEIEHRVLEECEKHHISIQSIQTAATIDLKQEEQGLLAFCEKYEIPITFYTAEELREVPGVYQSSGFVQNVTGVDNVCERAAIRKVWEELCGKDEGKKTMENVPCVWTPKPGRMVIEKSGKEGVTIALAERDWSVEFE